MPISSPGRPGCSPASARASRRSSARQGGGSGLSAARGCTASTV
ncbi:hypothetical protein [Paenibacillus tengchongensis]|nr:hypothetical protein [Paenibacillus tengchongensis]